MRACESTGHRCGRRLGSLLSLVMLAMLFAALAWGCLTGGAPSSGLGQSVDAALHDSGVESRVTAVLLNYRAYDTLLECFVLFLGVVVVWSLRPYRPQHPDPPIGSILASLVRFLIPLMVLVGGYLLWAGSNQAGGAFQAGAILGGAGVLLLLASSPLLHVLPKVLLPGAICLGPLFFLVVAVGAMVLGGVFLGYRRETAAIVIVVLEAVAAGAIGLSLAALFRGSRPEETSSAQARTDALTQEEGQE